MVKHILSHPQDPLVAGLVASSGGTTAIRGLTILPED